jgi:hypothetical protein
MANRSFLLELDEPADFPTDYEPPTALAGANYSVPLLWLTLFGSEDVVSVPTSLEPDEHYSALIAATDVAVQRSRRRVERLRHPGLGIPTQTLDAWLAYLATIETRWVAVATEQVVEMYSDNAAWSDELHNTIGSLDGTDEALSRLVAQQGVATSTGGDDPYPEVAAILCGYSWTKPVPWEAAIAPSERPANDSASPSPLIDGASPAFSAKRRRFWRAQRRVPLELKRLVALKRWTPMDVIDGQFTERRANMYLFADGILVGAPPTRKDGVADGGPFILSVGWIQSPQHFAFQLDYVPLPRAASIDSFPLPPLRVCGVEELNAAGVQAAITARGTPLMQSASYPMKTGGTFAYREVSSTGFPKFCFLSMKEDPDEVPFAVTWTLEEGK